LTAILNTPTSHGSLSFNSNGSFAYTPSSGFLGTDSFTYYASDGLKQTLATATIEVNAPILLGKIFDGYLSGSTVFADANQNGVLDSGEPSTLTDGGGNFTLPGAAGPLVMIGGTDIASKLAFQGHLNAPVGSSAITPLTTLIVALSAQGVGDPMG